LLAVGTGRWDGFPADRDAHRGAHSDPDPNPNPAPGAVAERPLPPAGPAPGDASHLRTMMVTGDIIPARQVNVEATQRGDFLWPFRPTADFVKNADVVYGNLESPLFAGCKATSTGFQFCGDGRFVSGLTFSGVSVVNLANNHFSNYGAQGIQSTTALLDKAGIKYSGLGPAAILDVKGRKFAFLGYNGVGLAIDRQAIDSGADIVIGNHPHWYQGIEVYKGKLVTYAHGNYVFDQMWSEETRQGVLGTDTFYDNKLVAASWKPIRIYDYGQARFQDPSYDQNVLSTMEQASKDLATKLGEPTT
jgi:poly-gamma-glutamate synthesis protein (capsule biosynthesis protein)